MLVHIAIWKHVLGFEGQVQENRIETTLLFKKNKTTNIETMTYGMHCVK